MKNIFFFSLLFAISSFILFSNLPTKQDKQIDCPIPIYPDSTTMYTGDSCTFVWSKNAQASYYEFSLSTTKDFNESSIYASSDTTLKIALRDNITTVYFWKIRSCKDEKTLGTWSKTMRFSAYQVVPEKVWRSCADGCDGCPHPCRNQRPYNSTIQ